MSPKRAIILTRISDDRDETGALMGRGVAEQEADGRALAARLGWSVWRVATENHTSAFKRRKITLPDGTRAMRVVRPEFRAVLDDLAAGRADGLIALDLDRAVRDPRDLEDLIDIVESRHVPVESVTGSLRLATDADVTMARVLVAVANKSSRDTSRRVSRARLRAVETGRYSGGRRAYGFEADGITVRPAEAREVVAAAHGVLEGISLRELVLDLKARGVPTTRGAPWSTPVLRTILLRPRNAGLMVHRGQVLDVVAQWEPLLDRDVYDSVVRILTDPGRKISPGNTPRWLGSGIYRCVCGGPVCIMGAKYRCRPAFEHEARQQRGHVAIPAVPTDRAVEVAIIGRLSLPDTIALAGPTVVGVDVPTLRSEAAVLRARLSAMAEDFAEGVLSRVQLQAGTKRAQGRLDDIETTLSGATGRSPLSPLVGAKDVATTWAGLSLGARRGIVDYLATVEIQLGVIGKRFDPNRIHVNWRT